MTTIGYQVSITTDEWVLDEERGIYVCNKPVGEEIDDQGQSVPTHKIDPTHDIDFFLEDEVMIETAEEGKKDLVRSFINHVYANQWMQVSTHQDHAEFRWMRNKLPAHDVIIGLEEYIPDPPSMETEEPKEGEVKEEV